MGIDCKIELGMNAKSSRILDVIQKTVGLPYTYEVFNEKPFDINSPSSQNNPWRMVFERCLGKTIGSEIVGCFNIQFVTLDGEEHSWFASMETEEEDSLVMLPGAHSLSMLVGKRLVDFFGGRVLFNDMYDWENKNYSYKNNTPHYGKKLKKQSSDERFYQFFNELNNFEPLSEKDLLFFEQRAIDLGTEGFDIVHQVSKTVMHRNLQEKLPEKTTQNKKNKI